jgi:3-oxoacyl-[acyl-carrier protein] reductase
VSSRTQEAVDRTVTSLGAGSAAGVVADNADPETPGRLVEATFTAYGRLDGALISVGGPTPGKVLDSSDEDWEAGVQKVLLGGVRLGREIARSLGDGGAIAYVLSSSVKVPIPGLAISNGLRPGLAMFAKDLADEVGPQGIRVNGLLPGRIDTDRIKELDAATGDPDAARTRHSATIPLGRYGTPEEFGRVAAFLLSPAASYVTGAMVPVDGGLLRAL